LVENVLVVSKGGCFPEWGVYQDLECYNNTRLFYRGRGQEWARRVENPTPGNVDIQILEYWNRKNEG
jgi:hypothetical protein